MSVPSFVEDTSNAKFAFINSLITPTDEAKALEADLKRERIQPYIVDVRRAMPDIEPLVAINGSCVCSRGNISAICGEAKSRKTFLTSALVASAIALPAERVNNFKNISNNMYLSVLWVDTEQGETHVRKVINRITTMTGAALGGAIVEPRLTTLALRELAPHERRQMLYDAMSVGNYDIVVIDGIADLQRNTNDLEESDALITELMALSTRSRTHIICVLHTNPGSDKARGHLGSSLQRKAESVLFVHRVGEKSIVEPQFCRNEPFERFAFEINAEGIPEIAELPTMEEDARNEVVAMVEDMFGGAIERTTLANKLIEAKGLKRSTAQMQIKRAIDRGQLKAKGNLIVSPQYVAPQAETGCHTVTQSQVSQGSTPTVTDVTTVTPVTQTLMPQPEIKPMAHYDYDCPF
ncbi:MAG: AAA family ATPase [Alistipes sp.]|nr:AAA family ATPase [Alistipes sp.]